LNILALKLVATPVLILMASLASRRWGEAVGGWIVGLPLTSAPVAFFVAVEQGPGFAQQAAAGSLIGTTAQACFCLGYTRAALRFGWPAALAVGALAFAAGATALQVFTLPLLLLLPLAVAALIAAAWLVPLGSVQRRPVAVPRWDIPARMIVATTIVVTLTTIAPALGPRLSGVLASFPVFASVLAVFAHRLQGPLAARQVLWGLLIGLFGFIAFFFVIAMTITAVGIGIAFIAATLAALAIQGASLWLVQRKNHDTAA
jgi:hypothetical protein